jgi:hypothetical protein
VPSNASTRWWDAEKDDVARAVVDVCTHLEAVGATRRWENSAFYRLATSRELPGVFGFAMSRKGWVGVETAYNKPSVNVIESAISTLTNKIGRSKPWLLFSSASGCFKERIRAKKLSSYVDGLFAELSVYDHARDALVDALTFGTGILKVLEEGGQIRVERPIADELLVDEGEALYANPRNLYQRRWVHRSDLLALYGDNEEAKAAIERNQGAYAGAVLTLDETYRDMIAVVESWHLPDPNGKKGRHVLAVGDYAVVDEKWTRDHFPFAFIRFEKLARGFWGRGVAELLAGIQLEINRLARVISEAQSRVGRPWVWTPPVANGGVKPAHVEAPGIGNVFTSITKPEVLSFPSVAADVYKSLNEWIDRAYRAAGVSELAAAAQLPKGLNGSGEAMREFHQQESERYVTLGQDFESLIRQVGELVLELAKELKPKVKVGAGKYTDEIKWDDVELTGPSRVRVFPLAAIVGHPAGKVARAQEMLSLGAIDKHTYVRIVFGSADLDTEASLETSAEDLIDHLLDTMIEDGEYQPPEKYMPLDLAISRATHRFMKERAEGTPEDRLTLVLNWIDDCAALKDELTPQNDNAGPANVAPGAPAKPTPQPMALNPALPSESAVIPATA